MQSRGSGVLLMNSSDTVLGSLMFNYKLLGNTELEEPWVGGFGGPSHHALLLRALCPAPGGKGSRESWWNGWGGVPRP